MISTFEQILQGVFQRLQYHLVTFLPPLLAALIIFVITLVIALAARWVLYKIFKGLTLDQFLRRTGVAYMIDSSGRLRATRLVAETVYWGLLLTGVLVGLSVFNSDLTTQITQSFVFLLPKLVVAGIILLAGAWLSQYLGRSMLVWAVNENLPAPRRLAALVRVVIMFVAVVVTAEYLDFARNVFLAAFIILVGGAVFGVSLALGRGMGGGMHRFIEEKRETEPAPTAERSLWDHL
ncbi:MAG: hypothetical protein KIT09_09015 [Bryobacteraceae bacterium]|nr:hypothetical protein [Bryobacteraceae bacterium]